MKKEVFFYLVSVLWFGNVQSNKTMEQLAGMLESHSQSLLQLQSYLVRTDQFWNWYSSNRQRLNTMLTAPQSSVAAADDKIEEILTRLQRLEQVSGGLREAPNWLDQEERLKNLEGSLLRLTEEQKESNARMQIMQQSLEETSQKIANLMMFVRQITILSNNSFDEINGRIDKLSASIKSEDNLSARITNTTNNLESVSHDINWLRNKTESLEDHQRTTVVTGTYLNSSVEAINKELRNITDETRLFPDIDSRLNVLKDKVERFVNGSGDRSYRAFEETCEEKVHSLEENVNYTRSALLQLTGDRREDQENIIYLKDQLQDIKTKLQNTETRFESVHRTVESLRDELTTVSSSVARIDGRLENNPDRLTDLGNTVTDLKREFTEIKTKIDGMEMSSPANVSAEFQEIRAKLTAIEQAVANKSAVRVRGDELVSSLFGNGENNNNNAITPTGVNSPFGNVIPPGFPGGKIIPSEFRGITHNSIG
ncbi:kinesin-like protein KIF20B isoform X2 [Hyalella azteca]|uniref:Kinesin-like protein KIF20B isoform X2 n=1 Tax=Hyalella azteca TaxID=294128 RepID=A0A8B7P124_HYAAZ|nr:kinesin-like protein KIF20B isoform X2 [Hyalella azteca]